ncbi:MAG: phage portal protein [Ignavibacteriae bacterium]|nr:phage portal protein [Ignavibacteriota bacterium]
MKNNIIHKASKYLSRLGKNIRCSFTGNSMTQKSYNSGWQSVSSVLQGGTPDKYKSFAYACINARAENIAKAKIFLFRRDAESGTAEEVREHPFLDLIHTPNRKKQTFPEILLKISASLDLYGNAYLYAHRGVRGKPVSLYYLPAKNVRINLNRAFTEVESYEYTAGGNSVKYKSDDIIHFMIPDPDSNIEGKSIISAFNYTLDIDYYQNLYQRSFYLYDASVGMILEPDPQLNDAEIAKMREQLRDRYEGPSNAGRTLILGKGIKANAYRNSPKDVEIIPSRKLIREEILTMFRVPKTILGITDEVNRANARESLKTFNDYVIKPFAKICIESKLNLFLAENYSDKNLYINMEYEFEIDRELQLQAYDIYRKYDIVSNDEIREIEGFGG